MLKKIFFLLAAILFFTPSLTKAVIDQNYFIKEPFVTPTEDGYIFWWKTAQESSATPYFKYGEWIDGTAQGTNSFTPKITTENGYLKATLTGLKPNTDYNVSLIYEDQNLTGYADSVEGQGHVFRTMYNGKTIHPNLVLEKTSRKYLTPGDEFIVYGQNFEALDKNSAYHYALLIELPWLYGTPQATTPKFEIVDSTLTWLKLKTPKWQTSSSKIEGNLMIYNQNASITNNQFVVTLLENPEIVERTVSSKYKNKDYLNLLNATIYQYGTRTRDLESERKTMSWLATTLKANNKGVDGLWSIVLANAIVYGGYTKDQVLSELKKGPGCVHRDIKVDTWLNISTAQNCFKK